MSFYKTINTKISPIQRYIIDKDKDGDIPIDIICRIDIPPYAHWENDCVKSIFVSPKQAEVDRMGNGYGWTCDGCILKKLRNMYPESCMDIPHCADLRCSCYDRSDGKDIIFIEVNI